MPWEIPKKICLLAVAILFLFTFFNLILDTLRIWAWEWACWQICKGNARLNFTTWAWEWSRWQRIAGGWAEPLAGLSSPPPKQQRPPQTSAKQHPGPMEEIWISMSKWIITVLRHKKLLYPALGFYFCIITALITVSLYIVQLHSQPQPLHFIITYPSVKSKNCLNLAIMY